MKKITFLLIMLLLTSFTVVWAADFAADYLVKMKGVADMPAKMFCSGQKVRVESNVRGIKTTTIVRTDKQLSWMLMDNQKKYMENKIDQQQQIGVSSKMPGEVKRQKLGREKINGVDCDKYLVIYKSEGKETSVNMWLTSDNIPMKTAAINGNWSYEITRLRKGAQPATLFEIPAGYTKMALPAIGGKTMDIEAMKKMMKGMH